jgi:hypothetical protein
MKCVKWGDRLKLEEFALHSTCIGSAPNVSHFVPSHNGALFSRSAILTSSSTCLRLDRMGDRCFAVMLGPQRLFVDSGLPE